MKLKSLFQRGVDSPPPTTARRSPRQLWWGGLFLSSLIAMGSTFEAVRMQRYYAPSNATQRWAVGSITAVFLLAFAVLALQLIPRTAHLLLGTKLELSLILLASAFACAAVGSATNPATGMAVNLSGGVSFGNLFYSAWACFGCGVALLMSFLRTERGMDVSGELKSRGNRFRLWAVLVIVTLIVMGSSASTYDAKCGVDAEYFPKKYCRRAAFGVSAGCIGCVGSLAVVAMRLSCTKLETNGEGRPNKVIFAVECISGAVLLCFYCFAVAYLTSEEGPGAPLGNLYYSTWLAFGLTLFVAASCLEEIQAAKAVYKLRNGQGGDVSEGMVSVLNMSNRDGRPIAWPDNQNNFVPVESTGPVEPEVPHSGIRSGSVGEVFVAD